MKPLNRHHNIVFAYQGGIYMKRTALLTTSGLLFAGMAFAGGTGMSTSNLPDKGTVTLSGIVDNVSSNKEFTLRDNSGTIDVMITGNESLVLKNGDKVTVTGKVSNGFLGLTGKSIDATQVAVQKDLGSVVSDVVTATTGVSVDAARAASIANLPEEGMVKVSGTVANVISPKIFTLKDNTGVINVNVQSDENVVFSKSSPVTVIGYVDDSMLGKNIRATHVIVTADTPPRAGAL
jgi:uncharacterized protein YdeI (BOF family)